MAVITIGRRLNQSTDSVTATQGPAGTAAWPVMNMGQLVPEKYDEVSLSHTDGNLTGVVFKREGVAVATVTLSYTDGVLTHVVRT